MSAILRRGELIKLGRLISPSALVHVDGLDAASLRVVREAISARLFDDARPMLQRVATGSRLLPNATTARIAERVFGSMLCARIAGLLSWEHALDLAVRMSDPFLADVASQIDPRGAGRVIAAIPTDRVVAVAAILLARGDHVSMARFVDFLSPETIGAVIASIPDERELLHIGVYVEAAEKLAELVGQLPRSRLVAMMAALGDGDRSLWLEALAVATLLPDQWKQTLGDIVAELDDKVLVALVHAASTYEVWDEALALVHAMSAAGQARFFALRDEIIGAMAGSRSS